MTINDILKQFKPISLEEMDEVKLMNRTDTKYVFNEAQFLGILPELVNDYKALEIKQKRSARYQTLYFDTNDFQLYTFHHNGKKNRKKVRFRSYIDSNLSFLEVKHKDNKGQTVKKRIVVDEIEENLSDKSENFLTHTCNVEQKQLEAKLWNSFNRITLVNIEAKERLTIDYGLSFKQGNKEYDLKNIVIAEVKQEHFNRNSKFVLLMRKGRISQTRISKYATGTALLADNVKHNLFKEKLLQLKKIAHGFKS